MSTQLIQQVQALTGITKRQYSRQLYKSGMEYLTYYTDGDTSAIFNTIQRDDYWAWWFNQFEIADKQFVNGYRNYLLGDASVIDWLRREWIDTHKPLQLRVYPPQQLFKPERKEPRHA